MILHLRIWLILNRKYRINIGKRLESIESMSTLIEPVFLFTDIVRNVAQSCSIMCTKVTKRIGGIIQNDASPGWITKAMRSAVECN